MFLMLALSLIRSSGTLADVRSRLDYAPAPVDNPLKGLVPYAADVRDYFPHSLEFSYLPLSALVIGPNQYDWHPLETLLDAVAQRGHQTVVRIYLEYPGKKNVLPRFLLEGGLKVHRYLNTNTQPFPPEAVETPDYSDPNLRQTLRAFIRALGKRYDGDPRIGFITAGLLGTWGEWHTYPRSELFASKNVQQEVMDAFEAAFHVTPILLRYPAGEHDSTYAPNAGRPFGYHDDSFAWATLDTGKKGEEWFFLTRMRTAGEAAQNTWKAHPIGGEIRPEAWGRVFDPDPGLPEIQNFAECVEKTHATWLMDSGMFQKKQSEERHRRALTQVGRMGYEFHVPAVTIRTPSANRLEVQVEIVNRGVAPFYYDWPVEYALLGANGTLIRTFTGHGKLKGLLPDGAVHFWDESLNTGGIPPETYRLLLRIRNPLPTGHPLRFANASQDADLPGWLTLARAIPLP